MFFSEPFLEGAKIWGIPLEGANSLENASRFLKTLDEIGKYPENERFSGFEGLMKFKNGFERGTEFMKLLVRPKIFDQDDKMSWILQTGLIAQAKILENLRPGENAILPYRWPGHAVGLILQHGQDDKFNLVIINTGDGVDRHMSQPDPNGVYPSLSRLWIEFKGIPKEDIFDKDAWFVSALIMITNEFGSGRSIDSSITFSQYFYDVLLPNFRKYLVEPDVSSSKLFPFQRSGSCTMSSLIASLLYFSENDSTFYLHRAIIGHQLVNDFVNTHVTADNAYCFKTILRTSLDRTERVLFKNIASALAHQLASYLENTFPTAFNQFTLLGAETKNWIKGYKPEALRALENSKETCLLIQKTIDLAKLILNISNENKIEPDCARIEIERSFHKIAPNQYSNWPGRINILKLSESSTLEPTLSTKSSNAPSVNLTEIDQISDFITLIQYPWNVPLKSVINESVLDKIPNLKGEEMMKILETCRRSVLEFIIFQNAPTSLDELTNLAFLQLIAWETVVSYDKFAPLNLGFDQFSSPIAIQATLEKIDSIGEETNSDWTVRYNFDPANVSALDFVLKRLEISNDKPRFMGPKQFNSSKKFDKTWNNLDKANKDFCFRLFSHAQFDMDPLNSDRLVDFEKFQKVLTKDNADLYNRNFPHFYNFLDIIFWIYGSLEIRSSIEHDDDGRELVKTKTLESKQKLENALKSNCLKSDKFNYVCFHFDETRNSSSHNYLKDFLGFNINSDTRVGLVPSILTSNEDQFKVFFSIRHSEALRSSVDIVNFESWLNHVKGSTSLLFNNPYFVQLSDRILNFPKLLLINGRIQTDNTYFDGMKRSHITEVITELFKIVKLDVISIVKNTIYADKSEENTKCITRLANVALILVRFIERIDHDAHMHGKKAAKALAKVYNSLSLIGRFTSDLNLSDSDISRVNFVLAYICHIPIRNVRCFVESIELGLPKDHEISIFRRTLKRYHMFMAKSFYRIESPGVNLVDDLYLRYYEYIPVDGKEVALTNALLTDDVLPHFFEDRTINWTTFNYSKSGEIVIIVSECKHYNLRIQLSTGIIFKNGIPLLQSSKIFENSDVVNFFSGKNDMKFAQKGTLSRIGAYQVLLVENYKMKSNHILVICQYDAANSDDLKCYIFRTLFKGDWYQWITEDTVCDEILSYTGGNYLKGLKVYAKMDSRVNNYPEDSNNSKDSSTADCGLQIISITDGSQMMYSMINMTYSADKIAEQHFILQNFNVETPWRLNPVAKNIKNHLYNFSSGKLVHVSTKQKEIVIIYPHFRFPGELDHSLVFMQESINGVEEFKVLNDQEYSIEEMQTINDEPCWRGTLLSKGKGGKQYLMVPIREIAPKKEKNAKQSNDNSESKDPINLELVPLIDHQIVPQTRLQSIILAYYAALYRDYNIAMNLLHPIKQVRHNEILSENEIQILDWITSITIADPQMAAIKLVAIIHVLFNNMKFPIIEKDRKNSHEKKILSHFKSKIPILSHNYLMALRELSEKFHVFKHFPQLSHEPLFSQIFRFSEAKEDISIPNDFEDFTWTKMNPNLQYTSPLIEYWPEPIKKNFVKDCLHKLLNKETDPDIYEENCKRLRFATRIMPKTDHKRNDVIIFCISKHPDKFYPLVKELWELNKMNVYDFPENERKRLKEETEMKKKEKIQAFERLLEEIQNQNQLDINLQLDPINYSRNSTKTNPEYLKHVIKSNLKHDEESEIDFELFSKSIDLRHDIEKFDTLSKVISRIIEAKAVDVSAVEYFAMLSLEKSTVLRNLSASIRSHLTEKGHLESTEFDMNTLHLQANLEEFIIYLNSRIKTLTENQLLLAFNLERRAYSQNSSDFSKLIERITTQLHGIKPKLFSNIYSCYLKRSISCVQRKFPQFSNEECEMVYKEAFIFYTQQVLIDYMNFIISTIEKCFKGGSASFDDLYGLGDELEKIRYFKERMESPVILSFEYRSTRYRIRQQQIDDIKTLTTVDDKSKMFNSVVIQRMMAAGKTLVLGTISVITKALNSNVLSILVPPSSLYQSNTTSMQNRSYNLFKKKGNALFFPRFKITANDYTSIMEYLKYFIGTLENTMVSKDYLILSPETLHSFMNSYIEMIDEYSINGEFDALNALTYYASIFGIFKRQGSIILDEIDMTMDPKKEMNFPTQESEPYNTIAVALTADIIEFTIFDQSIRDSGLYIFENNQASLTSEAFLTCRDIILKYIEKELDTPKTIWNKHLKYRHSLETSEIIEFLKNPDMQFMKNRIEHHQDVYVSKALIIIKVQLHKYFEDALKGTVNLSYGTAGASRPEIQYAVPYVAANTPSNSSIFADRWETLNKSLLMVASVPCSRETAANVIDYVKAMVTYEFSITESIENCNTNINFKHLSPQCKAFSLSSEDESHVDLLHKQLILRSPAAIRILFSYFLDKVMLKIEFRTEQITSNAINVASMFGSVQGYSGTIDNVNILPHQVVHDAYLDHEANEKHNGSIALKLMKDSNESSILELKDFEFNLSVEEFTEHLVNLFNHEHVLKSCSAIIDNGAFFKSFGNIQVAKAILKLFKDRIDVVLYYDEKSNQLEFLRNSGGTLTRGFLPDSDPETITNSTKADVTRRFTFYDQRHITGSDILQPRGAHAIMTVGTRVLLRDILQGTLRMRQFMTHQTVHIVTTESARKFYSNLIDSKFLDSMKVSDILALGAFNEDEKQASENEKLTFIKIDNEFRSFILSEISEVIQSTSLNVEETKFDLVKSLFTYNRKLFIKSIKEDPLSWLFSVNVSDSKTVLKDYVDRKLEIFSKMGAQLKTIDKNFDIFSQETRIGIKYKSLIDVIEYMISDSKESRKDTLLLFLKDKIGERTTVNLGSEVELQAMSISEVQVNIQMDTILDNTYLKDYSCAQHRWRIEDLDKNNKSSEISYRQDMSLKAVYDRVISRKSELKPIIENVLMTTGTSIGVTTDLIRVTTNEQYKCMIFSRYTKEGSHLLVQVLPDQIGLRVLLVSVEVAKQIYDLFVNAPKPYEERSVLTSKYWLCDIVGRITATNDFERQVIPSLNIMELIPSTRRMIFDLLIFNGSLSQILRTVYLKEIYEKEWLNNASLTKVRATFLLARMEAMMQKLTHTFPDSDENITTLRRLAVGESLSECQSAMSSSAFLKSPVEVSDQNVFFENFRFNCFEREDNSHPTSNVLVLDAFLNATSYESEEACQIRFENEIEYDTQLLSFDLEEEEEVDLDSDLDELTALQKHAIQVYPIRIKDQSHDCENPFIMEIFDDTPLNMNTSLKT